jgi:PAS domain S-box-containing protein
MADRFDLTAELAANPKTLLDSLSCGIVAVDAAGAVVYVNPVAGALFGLSPGTAAGQPVRLLFPALGEKLLGCVQSATCVHGIRIEEKEIAVLGFISPIIEHDKTVGAISFFREMSEVEQVVTELDIYKKMHRQLDAIFESSYDGLFVTDGKGNIVNLNKSSARLNGYIREQVIGKNIKDMVCQGFIDRSVTLEVIEKKVSVSIMQRLKNCKHIIVTGVPVFDDCGTIEFVVTNERDIGMLNLIRTQLQEAQRPAKIHVSESIPKTTDQTSVPDIVAVDAKTRQVLDSALAVAPYDTIVLLSGESGVGKGLIARLIHASSPRRNGRLVKIDCGTIPDQLLESELFGYRRGAFTGADTLGKPGRILMADKGTLLLDEIGEVPLNMQVKLLRLLEEREIVPVGDTEARRIDTRVIATTNRDLRDMVARGLFREDLYYRLSVVPIHIPPLRERPEDIPQLISACLARLSDRLGCRKTVAPEVVDILSSYTFPGNVRQLENLMERLLILCPQDEIQIHHLPEEVVASRRLIDPLDILDQGLTLREAVEMFEGQLLRRALTKYGSKTKAAKALRVDPSTILRKTRKYMVTKGGAILH